MDNETTIKKLLDDSGPLEAFAMGYDCGRNGTNSVNCNFKLFNTPEKTKAWERGKAKGEEEKAIKNNRTAYDYLGSVD